ncbi:ty3-gypsy retrotransposon protein [Tanacetum coccineum]
MYPLPEIESLMGFKYKCFLNAYKEYHQILMAKAHEEKTTFHTDEGVFYYTKMSFGLKNARATYQRLTNTTFKDKIGVNLEAYVKDMVIKSKTELDIIKVVEETFMTLQRINMKSTVRLKPETSPRIPSQENGETALYIAASAKVPRKVKDFVKNLVDLMTEDDLALENVNYNTTLYLAAAAGNINTVKIMLDTYPKLLEIVGGGSNGPPPNQPTITTTTTIPNPGRANPPTITTTTTIPNPGRANRPTITTTTMIPIPAKANPPTMMPTYVAALFGNHNVVNYMYDKSNDLSNEHWTPQTRCWLFENVLRIICSRDFKSVSDVALKIVTKYPKLETGSVLTVLARKPKAFQEPESNFIQRTIRWEAAITCSAIDTSRDIHQVRKSGSETKAPTWQKDFECAPTIVVLLSIRVDCIIGAFIAVLMDEATMRLLLQEQHQASEQLAQQHVVTFKRQLDALREEIQTTCTLIQGRHGGGGGGGGEAGLPRSVRLDVPKFTKVDPESWLFSINKYFTLLNTPADQRLRIVGFNLEGAAAEWFHWMSRNCLIIDWARFEDSVKNHFGPSKYEDPQWALSKLLQLGSVEDYHNEFEKLMNRVVDIPKTLLISFYILGLKLPIQRELLVAKPVTLGDAFSLSRITAARLDDQASTSFVPKSSNTSGESLLQRPTSGAKPLALQAPPKVSGNTGKPLAIKWISPAEWQERLSKGLCFNCDNRWTRGHKCPAKFLLLMTESEDESSGEASSAVEEEVVESGDISILNSLVGHGSPRSLQLWGKIGDTRVHILIDNGSTHNFIRPDVVESMRLSLQSTKVFKVYIGSGATLMCKNVCPQVDLYLQRLDIKDEGEVGGASSSTSTVYNEIEQVVESGDISILNSLVGHGSPHSLQLWGKISDTHVHILIDNGSTHNFIRPNVVKSNALSLQSTKGFDIKVMKFTLSNTTHTLTGDASLRMKKISLHSMQALLDSEEIYGVYEYHGFSFGLSRVYLGAGELEYLGHIISARGVAIDPKKLLAVRDWLEPKTQRQVRGFLGLAGYYRRFIQGYASLAAPLTDLLKHDGFKWGDKEGQAFMILKQRLSTAPLLSLPNFDQAFVIEAGASGDVVANQPRQWVRLLPWAEYSYNSSYHSSIQMSPFQAVYGRQPLAIIPYPPGSSKVTAVDELLA